MRLGFGLACVLISSLFAFALEVVFETDRSGDTYSAAPERNYPVPIVFSDNPDSEEVFMYLLDEEGDTLWSCPLIGTVFDFHNPPRVILLEDGGFVVSCSPDCFSSSTQLQRVTDQGELVWSRDLETSSILNQMEYRELSPRVNSITELQDGNLVFAGQVTELMGSATAWYAACFNGSDGELLWISADHEIGHAAINDLIQISSGMMVAVGVTADIHIPEGGAESIMQWGEQRPLVVLLAEEGTYLGSRMPSLQYADILMTISESQNDEFALIGVPSGSDLIDDIVLKIEFL